MNCTSCSNPLPAGVAFCPTCGAAAPYNMPKPGAASPYGQTEAASSPYGNPSGYPPLPPTIAANADGYAQQQPQTPSYTNYGVPQQPSYDPYSTPASAYPNASPPPPPANPLGVPGPYYGQQQQPPMPGYPQGMQQPGMYGMPPKKRSKVGLIVGISVLAVVLLCGGLIVAATQIGKSTATKLVSSIDASGTADAGNVPTTSSATNTTTGGVPTAGDIVPAASKILFGVQTSSAVNTNYEATNVATTFPTNKDVDLVFKVDSAGQNGYIRVKWYEDGQEVSSDILKHSAKNDHGYFGLSYTTAGNASAALFWCTKADCSDEQLSAVVSFTITGSAAIPSHNNAIAITSWKNND